MKKFLLLLLIAVFCYVGFSELKAANPTVQARYVTFRTITSTSIEISFTRGNGANRLVIVREDNFVPPTTRPVNGQTYTHGATPFSYTSAGASVINGGRVVFNSAQYTSNPGIRQFTITDLQPNKTYWIGVFEYNGTGVNTEYNVNIYNPPYSYNPPNNPRFTNTAPPAVTVLPASELTCDGFLANWNLIVPASSTDTYFMEVREGLNGSGNPVNSTYGYDVNYDYVDVGSFGSQDVLDLNGNTVYSYRLRAVKGYRYGDWSAWQNVKTMTEPCPAMNGAQTVCLNGTYNYYPVDPFVNVDFAAQPDGNVTDNGTNANISWNTIGNKTVIANVTDAWGNTGTIQYPVTVIAPPDQPSAISGNTLPCENSIQTYDVTYDPTVTHYVWTLPSGWTGTSNTNSITVVVGNTAGIISVVPYIGDCQGPARTLPVNPVLVPAVSAITGPADVCENSTQTYSVGFAPGWTYTWSVPSGWTIINGQGTNQIQVYVGSVSGQISVYASNTCGDGQPVNKDVNVIPIPTQPSAISGNTNVFQYTYQTYSVINVPGMSYQWSVPTGWTIQNGQGTNSIYVLVGSASGNVTVFAYNDCGNSSTQSLYVDVYTGPPDPATNIVFNNDLGTSIDVGWTNGNGVGRILAVSPNPITWTPTDGQVYNGTGNYATSPEVATNVKVVYNGNGNGLNLTGIVANTVYYFKVFEYASGYIYQTANALNNPNQVKKLTFDNIGTKVSNTNFNDLTIRVRNRANAIMNAPANVNILVDKVPGALGTTYNNTATITAGSSSVVMSTFRYSYADGLTNAQLQVISTSDGSYLKGISNVFELRPEEPTLQASGVQVLTPDPPHNPCYARKVTWVRGNGSKCLVVGREASFPAPPVDYVRYNANSVFGSGSTVGNPTMKTYAVYKGTGTEVTVTNLKNNTLYYFRVFEFNGEVNEEDINANYLLSGGNQNPYWGYTANCSPRIEVNIPYVEVANYNARSFSGKALVSWQTNYEQNIAGFEVLRADWDNPNEGFVRVSSYTENSTLVGLGNSNSGKEYSLLDESISLQVGRKYLYQLIAYGFDGTRIDVAVTPLIIVEVGDDNLSLSVSPVQPNPVKDVINFTLQISREDVVKVEILDLAGRQIAVPFNARLNAGVHNLSFPFEGISSGMYILNVTAGTETVTNRFMYVK